MQTSQCRMTCKGLLTYLGVEEIVLHTSFRAQMGMFNLSLTSWFCILEMFISIYRKYLHYFERPCSHGMVKKTWRHERIILCICDQQVSFGQIMFSPPPRNKIFPVRRWFLGLFGLKTLCPFCSGIGYGFQGNYRSVHEWMYLLFQFQMNKNEIQICEFEIYLENFLFTL